MNALKNGPGVRRGLRIALLWLVIAGIGFTAARTARKSLAESGAVERWAPLTPDSVSAFETELGGARALLARERIVGYAFGASTDKLMTLGYEDQTRRFFLAQYALSPVLLSKVGERHWVFADFPTAAALDDYARQNGYAIRWRREGRAVLEAEGR